MNQTNQTKSQHPIIYQIKSFIAKLTQQPGIYPIKYYKKGQKLKKNGQMFTGI